MVTTSTEQPHGDSQPEHEPGARHLAGRTQDVDAPDGLRTYLARRASPQATSSGPFGPAARASLQAAAALSSRAELLDLVAQAWRPTSNRRLLVRRSATSSCEVWTRRTKRRSGGTSDRFERRSVAGSGLARRVRRPRPRADRRLAVGTATATRAMSVTFLRIVSG